MTLWDKLDRINKKSKNTIDVKLIINNLCVTEWISYDTLVLAMSIDILSLDESEYILEELYSDYTSRTNRCFRITINKKGDFE